MTERIATQSTPYITDEEPGVKLWCGCGRSQKQPYCDGSHAGTGIAPIRVVIEEKKKVAWCACRLSKNMPFCDGSHKALK